MIGEMLKGEAYKNVLDWTAQKIIGRTGLLIVHRPPKFSLPDLKKKKCWYGWTFMFILINIWAQQIRKSNICSVETFLLLNSSISSSHFWWWLYLVVTYRKISRCPSGQVLLWFPSIENFWARHCTDPLPIVNSGG